jgi:Mycoplasma protein of unknown function, DUF285
MPLAIDKPQNERAHAVSASWVVTRDASCYYCKRPSILYHPSITSDHMFLNALATSAVACFTSNAELRTAAVLYASNGTATTSATSNLSLTYGYPISEWCVDQVTDLSFVFANLTTFNEPLTNWNTSNAVTYVILVFENLRRAVLYTSRRARALALAPWRSFSHASPLLLSLEMPGRMKAMFYGATAYNQPIRFNTAKVISMESMFENAVNFAQDLTTFRYALAQQHKGMARTIERCTAD